MLTHQQFHRKIVSGDGDAKGLKELAIKNINQLLSQNDPHGASLWFCYSRDIEMLFANVRIKIALHDYASAREILSNIRKHLSFDQKAHLPMIVELEFHMLINTGHFDSAEILAVKYGSQHLIYHHNSQKNESENMTLLKRCQEMKEQYKAWEINRQIYFGSNYFQLSISNTAQFQYMCKSHYTIPQVYALVMRPMLSWRLRDENWVKAYLENHDRAQKKQARSIYLNRAYDDQFLKSQEISSIHENDRLHEPLIFELPKEVFDRIVDHLVEYFDESSKKFNAEFVPLMSTCNRMRICILENESFWRRRCLRLWKIGYSPYLDLYPIEWRHVYYHYLSIAEILRNIDCSSYNEPMEDLIKSLETLEQILLHRKNSQVMNELLNGQLVKILFKLMFTWREVLGEKISYLILILLEQGGFGPFRPCSLIYLLRGILYDKNVVYVNNMGLLAKLKIMENNLHVEPIRRTEKKISNWSGWLFIEKPILLRELVSKIRVQFQWKEDNLIGVSLDISTLSKLVCYNIQYLLGEYLSFKAKIIGTARWMEDENQFSVTLRCSWSSWIGSIKGINMSHGGIVLFPDESNSLIPISISSSSIDCKDNDLEIERQLASYQMTWQLTLEERIEEAVYCLERIWFIDEMHMEFFDMVLIEQLKELQDQDGHPVRISPSDVEVITYGMVTNEKEDWDVLWARKEGYAKKLWVLNTMRRILVNDHQQVFKQNMEFILSNEVQVVKTVDNDESQLESERMISKWSCCLAIRDPHNQSLDQVDILQNILKWLE